MARKFTVVIEKDEEGYLVGSVPALPGCHTQARSMDELLERIKEAIQLCLEVQGKHPDGRSTIVPVHSGETLGPGMVLKILRDVKMSREQLLTLLK